MALAYWQKTNEDRVKRDYINVLKYLKTYKGFYKPSTNFEFLFLHKKYIFLRICKTVVFLKKNY